MILFTWGLSFSDFPGASFSLSLFLLLFSLFSVWTSLSRFDPGVDFSFFLFLPPFVLSSPSFYSSVFSRDVAPSLSFWSIPFTDEEVLFFTYQKFLRCVVWTGDSDIPNKLLFILLYMSWSECICHNF